MLPTYDLPSFPVIERLLAPMASAEDAIARLDERLRRSPLADGLNARLAFAEACASRLAEGQLVHLEDLVLFDADAYTGPAAPELSAAWQALRTWRGAQRSDAAALLRADALGEPEAVAIAPERRAEGRSRPPCRLARRPSREQAPAPDACRRDCLGRLARAATGTARRLARPAHRRPAAQGAAQDGVPASPFLQWATTAAERAGKELDALTLAEALLRPKLARKRRSSRLQALTALLLSRPLVSAPMAARQLGVSRQAVQAMLRELGSPVRELSGRRRYRVWGIL
jgi:hypothetical protein